MKINVKNALRNEGEIFPVECAVPLDDTDFQGTVRFLCPPYLKGQFSCIAGELTLKGELTAKLGLVCSRCLEPFEQLMVLQFSESFTADGKDDTSLISDGFISLDDPVCAAILMNLDISRVCSADCKGLCPYCGQNRNNTACSCAEAVAQQQSPFSVLRGLVNDEEV